MFELHYTGGGVYPTKHEIETDAQSRGAKYSYWASEIGYDAPYNGDTVVVYDSLDNVPERYRKDAVRYGELISD